VNISDQLTSKKIFLFWVPLALTWLIMSFEQPFLIAFIARLGEAKYNLAAFGIAGSFALIVEAPIIMLMTASTALVRGRYSYKKLKKFTDILNASITIVQLIILIPPVFTFIVEGVMNIPSNVAQLAHVSLIIFLPWAASIGYRRFYQGLLIRNNLTRRVTYGTMVRLVVILIVGIFLYKSDIKGAYVGAAAMSLAVFFEAIASRIMAHQTIIKLLDTEEPDLENSGRQMTLRSITKFYYPLALTSMLSLGVHPFVTFFLGMSYMPVESLAVLPVVSSLVFIFRSVGLSYQEVNIALIGEDRQNYRVLRNYAVMLGLVVTAGISILAFTPLANIWFINVSGLSNELAELSYLPLKIMLLLPVLTVLLNFQRSTLVIVGRTGPISIATAIELVVIVSVMLVGVVFFNLVGVFAASIAFVFGKIASTMYLLPRQRAVAKGWIRR